MVVRGGAVIRGTAMLALFAMVLAPACRVQGLAFREDDRVEIVHPGTNQTVETPLTVRWTASDLGDLRFGVFVDVSPMPPLEGLAYFARDDDSCRLTDGCPDERYLADRGVYVTTETSFEIPALRDTRPPERRSAPDRHTVTISLLDPDGVRPSEAAWQVDFIVDRDA